jgi:hypothetical protein
MRSKALIIGALWPNKDTNVLLAAERDGVLPHVKGDMSETQANRSELIGRPGRHSHPPTPRRPDHKSLQAEATTCRSPGSVDCPGVLFVAVNTRIESLMECG